MHQNNSLLLFFSNKKQSVLLVFYWVSLQGKSNEIKIVQEDQIFIKMLNSKRHKSVTVHIL